MNENDPLAKELKIETIHGSVQEFLDFVDSLAKKYPQGKWLENETREWLQEESFKFKSITLLVKKFSRVIAALIGSAYTDDESKTAAFHGNFMIVDPEYQNQGVGHRLIQELKNKYATISLVPHPKGIIDVPLGEAQFKLVKFYEKQGFYSMDGGVEQLFWDRKRE